MFSFGRFIEDLIHHLAAPDNTLISADLPTIQLQYSILLLKVKLVCLAGLSSTIHNAVLLENSVPPVPKITLTLFDTSTKALTMRTEFRLDKIKKICEFGFAQTFIRKLLNS